MPLKVLEDGKAEHEYTDDMIKELIEKDDHVAIMTRLERLSRVNGKRYVLIRQDPTQTAEIVAVVPSK